MVFGRYRAFEACVHSNLVLAEENKHRGTIDTGMYQLFSVVVKNQKRQN